MLDRAARLSGRQPDEADLISDCRTAFEHDRDRILYSGHFRRLAGVTQVTTPGEVAGYHNRLTHTLEVAQISRRIAERAHRIHRVPSDAIDPDVCESAALAHDLGHPPFGHNGETVLDDLARKYGDGERYEGNAQSLRIVTRLAIGSGNPGLDLTVATLRGIVKYPWRKGEAPGGASVEKFGIYSDESDIFDRLWRGLPAKEQTLEAAVMDWADDIAYSVHDLADFYLGGLIPLGDLNDRSGADLKEVVGHTRPVRGVGDDHAYDRVAERLSTLEDPPRSTGRPEEAHLRLVRSWASRMIHHFIAEGTSFEEGDGRWRLVLDPKVKDEVAILKAITYHYVIGSPTLAVRQIGEERILKDLFAIYLEDLGSKNPRLFRDRSKDVSKTRTVLDALSSLTDSQAVALHQKLMGTFPASITDTLPWTG